MPDVPNFLPSRSGFHFVNGNWPSVPNLTIKVAGVAIPIGDASNGLCGGMVFAVRDYFQAKMMPPGGTSRPDPGTPLFDYICTRLYDSFELPLGPLKYNDWMTSSNHDVVIGRSGLAHRTILDEWPLIKSDLDKGSLSCLALVCTDSADPTDMGVNHQVLAYGYDMAGDKLTVKVYDPNSPNSDKVRISLSLANPGHTTPITSNVGISHGIRGFFRIGYAAVAPPMFEDAQCQLVNVPTAMDAGSPTSVTVRVRNTGSTSWSPGGNFPYRLGSQDPADNLIWKVKRVELPGTVNPGDSVDLTFTVTPPIAGGTVAFAWGMLKEGVHWFGRVTQQHVNVVLNLADGPLINFWSATREDHFATATAAGKKSALDAGYVPVSFEGRPVPATAAGVVQLKSFYHPDRGDNFTTATPEGEASALAAGYRFVRVEMLALAHPAPGCVPLKQYWHAGRGDNLLTADADLRTAALNAGYVEVRTEGYVPQP